MSACGGPIDKGELDQCNLAATKLVDVARQIEVTMSANLSAQKEYIQRKYIWDRVNNWYDSTIRLLQDRQAKVIAAGTDVNRCSSLGEYDYHCQLHRFNANLLTPQLNGLITEYNNWRARNPAPILVQQEVPDFQSNFACNRCQQCAIYNNVEAGGSINLNTAQSCVMQMNAQYQQQQADAAQRAEQARLAEQQRIAAEFEAQARAAAEAQARAQAEAAAAEAASRQSQESKKISVWVWVFLLFILVLITGGVAYYMLSDLTPEDTQDTVGLGINA